MPTFAVMYPRFWHVSPESLFLTFELASWKVGSIHKTAIGRRRCCHNPNSGFFLGAYHPDFQIFQKKKTFWAASGLFFKIFKSKIQRLASSCHQDSPTSCPDLRRSQVNALTSSRPNHGCMGKPIDKCFNSPKIPIGTIWTPLQPQKENKKKGLE